MNRSFAIAARRLWLALLAPVLLLALTAVPAHATFPGKNGKVVFGAFAPTPPAFRALDTINPDGSGQAVLVDLPAYETAPAWSADGTRVAFTNQQNLYVVNADGTEATNIGGKVAADHPAWSPDGTRIAYDASEIVCGFHACFLAARTIRVVNPDGTGDAQVSPPDLSPENPVWSPDGTRIAFDTGYDGLAPSEIYVMNVDGTGVTKLTHQPPEQIPGNFEPNWSPDGHRIAFQKSGDIWAMNADGSAPLQLTATPGFDDSDPAWSPDGTKIVFERADEVWVMSADGSAQTKLLNPQATDPQPDWQSLPGPQQSDYNNTAKFCKAERAFLGDPAFIQKYGGGANAYGKCVSK